MCSTKVYIVLLPTVAKCLYNLSSSCFLSKYVTAFNMNNAIPLEMFVSGEDQGEMTG